MAGQAGRSGGPRPNSGPKPKAEKYESPRLAAEAKIIGRLQDIVDAEIELALGVTVQEIDRKTGQEIVYTRPPDHRACAYLIDRVCGAPKEAIEVKDVTDPANRPGIPNGMVGVMADVIMEVIARKKAKPTAPAEEGQGDAVDQ